MTVRRPPAARAAFARYRHLPRSTHARLAVRWLTCPLPAVAAEVPACGRVLDLGCGHGFLAHYLAADGPTRAVHGVEVDGAKIAEARLAAATAAPAPTFEVVEAGWRPPPDDPWDAIVVVDVLYLLGHEAAIGLLGAAARAIAPGGRLVVKEVADTPRWKHRLAVAQELAATRLAKVTQGATVAFLDPTAIAGAMHDAGLGVRERPIGRGYPIPTCSSWGTGRSPAGARPPGRHDHHARGRLPADGYFDTMAAHAGGHWWYRARRALVAQLLDGLVPAGGVALDIGCGTGEVVGLLADLGAGVAAGTDLSDHVLHHVLDERRAGHGVILASVAEQLPFAGDSADVLSSLEVVEHLDDDLGALREYHRVLRRGATLLVTVPSYRWLWYHQDDLAGHRRRYTRRAITEVVEAAGFEVARSSYYFSFLVPPAVVQRKTPLRRYMDDNGETSSSGPLVTALMERLCQAERAWMRRGWPVPFGLSIWVLARRS